MLLTIVIVIAAFGRERRQGRGQKHRQDAALNSSLLCLELHTALSAHRPAELIYDADKTEVCVGKMLQ